MSISAPLARPALGNFSLLVASRAGLLLCGAPTPGPRQAPARAAARRPLSDLDRSGFEALAAIALAAVAVAPFWSAGTSGIGASAAPPAPPPKPDPSGRLQSEAPALAAARAPEPIPETFAACVRGPDEPSAIVRVASKSKSASRRERLASAARPAKAAEPAPAPRFEFAMESGWAMPTLGSAAEAAFRAKLTAADGSGRYEKLARAAREHAADKPNGWPEMVEAVRSALETQGEAAALALANAMLNKVPYVDGTDGSYFSPARFFRRGGVCKDYAVGKYLLLTDAGFDPEKLRVASMGPLKAGNPWHVVLLAKPSAGKEVLVLDMNPRWFALQDLAATKETKQMRVQRLAETGVRLQDVEKDAAAVYPISKYPGARRGLGWVGNGRGGSGSFVPGPGKAVAGACPAPLWTDEAKPGSEVCESDGKLWLSETSEGKIKIVRKIEKAELEKLLAASKAKAAARQEPAPASDRAPS